MPKRYSGLWVLHALLSHWLRHPVQLGTFMLGLLAATALWSGVQALNQHARASYDQAATRFNSINQAQIVPVNQQPLTESDYIMLRRLGWQLTPVVEGALANISAGDTLNIIGIEPMTLQASGATTAANAGLPSTFSLTCFLSPPWEIWVSPATAEQIKSWFDAAVKTGFPYNPDGNLVNLRVSSSIADNEIITDIYLAQYWLQQPDQLSRLLLLDTNTSKTLPAALAAHLRVVMPQSDYDISRLTASFHLNLTALSMLAFLVGLLMVYSAIHLAMAQRAVLRRILFSCGISQGALTFWLLIELLLLSGLITLPGLTLGFWIAVLLLPDFSASLTGLYGANTLGELTLSWQWWLQGLVIAWGGVLLAAIVPMVKLIKGHASLSQARSSAQGLEHPVLLTGAGSLCILLALGVAWFGESLFSGFLLLALIFISAALLMPATLNVCLRLMQCCSRSAVVQWLWADARMQVSHLSVALVALLLALSTSIGVGGMVEGFRNTFTGWLDQRLAAEVYLRIDDEAQAQQVDAWLLQHPAVSALLPSAGTDSQVAGIPVELRGIQLHSTYSEHWPLLSSIPDAWQEMGDNAAVMINEQLARQLNLKLGDTLPLAGRQQTGFTISAIYSDYGNPKGQVLLSLATLQHNWADTERGSTALRVEPTAVAELISALTAQFSLNETQVIDQHAVKRYSLQLFERTFAATNALNVLVLLIAAIALFSSLLTLSTMRLQQLAPVWACGLSRRYLVATELLKLLSLALLTALLAIPLGLLISYCLVAVINVRSFGWALPWQFFPSQWLLLTMAALVSAFLAAIIPVLTLQFTSPSSLLKGFRDEQ